MILLRNIAVAFVIAAVTALPVFAAGMLHGDDHAPIGVMGRELHKHCTGKDIGCSPIVLCI